MLTGEEVYLTAGAPAVLNDSNRTRRRRRERRERFGKAEERNLFGGWERRR
jgi:hypothetical protein